MQFNRLKLVGKYSFYGYFTFTSLHKNNINIEIINFEKNYFKFNFNFSTIKHLNMCLPNIYLYTLQKIFGEKFKNNNLKLKKEVNCEQVSCF